MTDLIKIGVLGSGTMGSGIAQVAAQSGHRVVLVDINKEALDKAKNALSKIMMRMVEKGNWTEQLRMKRLVGLIFLET